MEYGELKLYVHGMPRKIRYIKQDGNDKYGLLPDKREMMAAGIKYEVMQIIALRSFENVRLGETGGYISSFDNLDKDGECWLSGEKSMAVGSTIISGDAYVSNVICVNSRITGDCDIDASGESNYVQESTINNSGIYGTIRIMSSIVNECFLDCNGLCKINKSTLMNVRVDDTEDSLEFIKCNISHVEFCSSISVKNINLGIMSKESPSLSDVILVDGSETIEGEYDEPINILRTLFKGETFTWKELFRFIGSDGTREAGEQSDKITVEESDTIKTGPGVEQREVSDEVELAESIEARQNARAGLEAMLKELANG